MVAEMWRRKRAIKEPNCHVCQSTHQFSGTEKRLHTHWPSSRKCAACREGPYRNVNGRLGATALRERFLGDFQLFG